MQYKIPVQIENEDPIVLGLSLRQLTILMVGGGISYSIFNGLMPQVGKEVAAIPSIIIFGITLMIALFKQYEMTFVPFILALLRFNINYKERLWQSGVDNFHALQIGNVTLNEKATDNTVSFETKAEKIEKISDKLEKL